MLAPGVKVDRGRSGIIARALPNPAYGGAAAWASIVGTHPGPQAYEPQVLTVIAHQTYDERFEFSIPLGPAKPTPDWLLTTSRPSSAAVGENGWVVAITLTRFVDARRLVPGDFAQRAPATTPVNEWGDELRQEGGQTLRLGALGQTPDGELHEVCFVSWSDVGIPSDQLDLVDSLTTQYGMRRLMGVWHHACYAWASAWDGTPLRSSIVEWGGECGQLVTTESGFAAIVEHGTPGSYHWLDQQPSVHFSADGASWSAVELPTRPASKIRRGYHDVPSGEPFEVPVYVCSVETAANGVIIRDGIGFENEAGSHPCSGYQYWFTDHDLTDWQLLDPES